MHPALEELQARGLIYQSTDISELSDMLNEGRAVYCGFDPTADSLHIGSLLPLHILNILKRHGVRVVVLVGGGTGRIGDPSFKDKERTLIDDEQLHLNYEGVVSAINQIIPEPFIVNNEKWQQAIPVLDFLRDYGKYFTVNSMLAKDSVKSRLERQDSGISFAEFSYPILQGLDFEYLYTTHDVGIQIGGSDQWGNMIAGTDLIHKKYGNDKKCGVLTFPLITKADGIKFGKSESGAVWLSDQKTSVYDFLQFWLNITDAEFLKLYPCFDDDNVNTLALRTEVVSKPEEVAMFKKQFAYTITEMVHGRDKTLQASAITELVHGDTSEMDAEMFEMIKGTSIPTVEVPKDFGWVELVVETGLAPSRKMAREHISTGAIKMNAVKVNTFYDPLAHAYTDDMEQLPKYFCLRRGKTKFVAVKVL